MHTTRSSPSLSSTHESWLSALKGGAESLLAEGLVTASADDRFRIGYVCAMRNIPQGVSMLMDVISPEDAQIMGIHFLEVAILHENYDLAEIVRDRGIDPFRPFEKSRSFEGGSVFQRRNAWASKWLDGIKVGKLLDDDFLHQWRRSRLPDLFLFRAIHHNPIGTVDYLISQGASPIASSEAYVPLWSALRAGKADVMDLLLRRGASVVEAGIMAGKTLLVNAAERGLAECVWLLIEAGASVSDRSCGIDAPHAARAAGHLLLASEMEAAILHRQSPARGAGLARRL